MAPHLSRGLSDAMKSSMEIYCNKQLNDTVAHAECLHTANYATHLEERFMGLRRSRPRPSDDKKWGLVLRAARVRRSELQALIPQRHQRNAHYNLAQTDR